MSDRNLKMYNTKNPHKDIEYIIYCIMINNIETFPDQILVFVYVAINFVKESQMNQNSVF